MTPEERAGRAIFEHEHKHGSLAENIIQEIREAVLEEREACAKVCEHFAAVFKEESTHSVVPLALADRIRKRI